MRIVPFIAALSLCSSVAASAETADKNALPSLNIETDTTYYGDYLAARFAANHHDLPEAAKFYSVSLDHDPTNPQLLTFAFFFAATAGEIDDAADLAKRVVVNTPDDRVGRLTLAVAAMKHGQYKAARAQIAKSAKGPFALFTVALLDAWAATGMGDAAGAAADMKILHALPTADGLAYFNEALIAEYLGRPEAAEAAYKLGLQSVGPTPRVIDAYGRFLERNGRSKEAGEIYQKLASDNAFGPIAKAGLARIAAGQKPDPLMRRPEEGAAEALFGIAASLNDDNNRDISILYLRLALYLQPDLDLAKLLLADRFEAIERYEDAIAAYHSVDKASPFYRLAGVEVAIDELRLEKTDDAIADLQAILAAYPDAGETWAAMGDAYRQAKKYPEATKAYTQAIQAAGTPTKKNWQLFFARAFVEQQANDWNAAEADLQQALVLSPDQPEVLNFLGYSWVDQRRNIKQAVAMLEKARALSPRDGYIIDSVGWAYYQLGRYGDAAKTLEQAIRIEPGDPTINDHLGDAYWKTGRRIDARFQWSHAIAFGAEAGEKSKIEKKLESGLNGDHRS